MRAETIRAVDQLMLCANSASNLLCIASGPDGNSLSDNADALANVIAECAQAMAEELDEPEVVTRG